MATIKEIAEPAGVSITVVLNVINYHKDFNFIRFGIIFCFRLFLYQIKIKEQFRWDYLHSLENTAPITAPVWQEYALLQYQ